MASLLYMVCGQIHRRQCSLHGPIGLLSADHALSCHFVGSEPSSCLPVVGWCMWTSESPSASGNGLQLGRNFDGMQAVTDEQQRDIMQAHQQGTEHRVLAAPGDR